MELQPRKIFTVEEAGALLDTLREVLGRLGAEMGRVRSHSDRLQLLDVLWGDRVRDPMNPDHAEYREARQDASEAVERVEALIRDEILARGVRFPVGGIEHGLLDFPTTLDGRVVFLCWQMDEPSIAHWHEVDGGFAGRRPVTDELARRMGG